jgi:predicted unusual protein kinase regulating ubiquinone biosynthesis (AarF/ABC1/UbiB family)
MDLSTNHLQRYKQIASLLWKYGRSDLVKQMQVDYAPTAEERTAASADAKALAHELADDLEAMGPTYVKVGQVLSSRPDLLPKAYLEALARLQDDVKPFAWEEVERIVESELGARLSKAFSRFDREPLAAASLGQVHGAALRDGREVVVKVQRPGIVETVTNDFDVLAQIARLAQNHSEIGRKHRLREMVEELRVSIMEELDYEREAQNLRAVGQNLARFDRLRVPRPVDDYSTRRILTMERISGTKITALSPVARLDYDGSKLADQLFHAYLQQVLVDGLFHADPHPGNVFLTDEGNIALLDLGMVGHTTPQMQDNLLKILMSVSEGRSDETAETALAISQTDTDYDAVAFKRAIGRVVAAEQGRGLQQINVGQTLLEVTTTAANLGVYLPSELTLLGKTLLQLDEVGRVLDPQFDPNAAIRRHAAELLSQKMRRAASQGNVLETLLEMKGFFSALPARLNRVMDLVGNRELEMKVRAVDAPLVMEGLQKIANRVTSGLILAAMIIGAALLMRVDTSFRIWGYPGIAIICFLAAAAGGCWLLATIFVQDRRAGKP